VALIFLNGGKKNMGKLITEKQAAQELSLAVQTLRNWRFRGNNIVPYIKLGTAIRYDADDIEKVKEVNKIAFE
jgi:hypothetical protein